MLYYSFRKSLSKCVQTTSSLIEGGAPDIDEHVPEEIDRPLRYMMKQRDSLAKLLDALPSELPNYPDKRFGPGVAPADIQKTLYFLLPLALSFGEDFPLLSYFPIEFFQDKSVLVIETMNLYCEWKSFFQGQDSSKFKVKTFIHDECMTNEDEIPSIEKNLLPVLFDTLEKCSIQAKRDIEKEFSKPFNQI